VRWAISLAKSLMYVLMISSTYYFFGYQNNESYGYGQIHVGSAYILMCALVVIFGVYLFRREYEKPSDYFLLLYGMVVLIPYSLLYDVWGGFSAVNFIAVLVPFFGVMIFCRVRLKISPVTVVSEEVLVKFLLLLSVFAVVALLINSPVSSSFSLVDSHVRRLESRELYGTRTFVAYVSSIVMNCMLPLMFFWGVLRSRVVFVAFSIFLYIGFYYIYGVKAPLIYMFFAGGFAYFLRRRGGEIKFFNIIYYMFLSMFVLAWVEFWLFGYSYVEDYLIRRIFYVGSYLVGAYLQVISGTDFSFATGLLVSKSASMYVGEDFLGLSGLNANTNAFLYLLLQYGLGGYLCAITLVGVVLVYLNSLCLRSEVFVFISLMFGVLVLEQSVTTTLLSSGIGVLLVLFYFSRKRENNRV
jgi:hypothetical protein